jgi:hypothetical protein
MTPDVENRLMRLLTLIFIFIIYATMLRMVMVYMTKILPPVVVFTIIGSFFVFTVVMVIQYWVDD